LLDASGLLVIQSQQEQNFWQRLSCLQPLPRKSFINGKVLLDKSLFLLTFPFPSFFCGVLLISDIAASAPRPDGVSLVTFRRFLTGFGFFSASSLSAAAASREDEAAALATG
jgi:hypothetical protein